MQIGVVGVNHKLAGLHLREALAKACHKHFLRQTAFHGEQSFLLLSTCNRTEIYFSSDDLSRTHTYLLSILRQEVMEDFDKKLYSFFDFDCFHHLLRVTCGLDSAIIGETEIQGQIKKAYLNRSLDSFLPSDLHFIFQKALRVGKHVRSSIIPIGCAQNLEHSVYKICSHYFNVELENKKILFIGASATNLKILKYFQAKGSQNLTICNRTDHKGFDVARQEEISFLNWNSLYKWCDYDCIILGTKSPDPLIGPSKGCLEGAPKLIMDLSVPRNADPKLGRVKGLTLLNIDQLNRSMRIKKNQLQHSLSEAENYTKLAANKYSKIFQKKRLGSKRIYDPDCYANLS